MTDQELMRMALNALEKLNEDGWILADFEDEVYASIEALRARLAQPEQPQIVWIDNKQTGNFLNIAPPQREEGCAECGKQASEGWALYCVECIQLAREWQGLTDDEVNNFAAGCHLGKSVQGAIYEAAAMLKEKNA